jgi:pimeloyl-ACP methyl ester carboxylesterase
MDMHPPETREQDIGEVTLQYLLYEGGEPTIVLQHATGFLPWLWHPIARELAGKHRVIAPYFCDHRETDLGEGGLVWMTLAGDLAGLCRRLQLKSPILVGHSMGATVMTLAEAVYGIGAGGMILIEPVFFPEIYYETEGMIEDFPLVAKALRRRNRWADAAEVKAYLKSKELFANWEEEFLDLYIEHGTTARKDFGLELTCPPQKEAGIFKGGVARNPWPLLPRVGCPVLVLEGGKSDIGPVVNFTDAASHFENGRYRRIDDAGHLIPMEKPKETLAIIFEFIESVSMSLT